MSTDEATERATPDWPVGTMVIRGGVRDLGHLAKIKTRDGSWSVVAQPAAPFEVLCSSVRHGTVRRTTVGRIRAAGGWMEPTPDHGPPFHCLVGGLTPMAFDAILGPEEPNPVPSASRWRGDAR